MQDLQLSPWKRGKPVKMIIHGFTEGGGDAWVRQMKNRLLDDADSSIISVDWKALVWIDQ